MFANAILHQDQDLIIVNKPNNQLVHPSHYARNIQAPSLIENLQNQLNIPLYPAHRLDYKTSGIVIFAKNKSAVTHLQTQFSQQTIQKNYTALMRGYVPITGTIDTPVKRYDSKQYKTALTHYQTLATVQVPIAVKPYAQSRYSWVNLQPKTGRMHQLRIHANKIAHPIIGDHRYGNRHHNHMFAEKLELPNLFLHAHHIQFMHPTKNNLVNITAPYPSFWAQMAQKIGLTLPVGISFS